MLYRSLAVIALLWIVPSAMAANFGDTLQTFRSGEYEAAESAAREQVEGGVWNERWSRLLIECELTRGDHASAIKTYEAAVSRYSTSMALRLLGIESYQQAGMDEKAMAEMIEFEKRLLSSPTRYVTRDNLLAIGRYLAMRGEDAREILKRFYDRVRDADPTYTDVFIATAELAIDKHDYAVAAETLEEASELDDTDPRIAYLSALAWQTSDPKEAENFLNKALRLNPRHVPSLLLRAEKEIDAESYDDAKQTIRQVLAINVHEPFAWALSAVIDHVEGHYEIEKLKYAAATTPYSQNAKVDHLIGRKLAEKYRFAEAARYQRLALEKDNNFAAAKFELSQDLLRLGEDAEGWMMAEEAGERDPYNVVIHNLMTLKDRMETMETIHSDGIIVRMDAREAKIYGDAVLALLSDAKKSLAPRYEAEIDRPIVVEIFANQNDFAIRTFGLPGGAGYLGVCFGRVITANSPSSQGELPANWQSVLWHEFCHVVTLEKTKNRMPRWLSEGISVYEERIKDSSWGEAMSPQYRKMILDGQITPVQKLSGAFLNPPSPQHLMFAYFQSSLVVEYIVDEYGMEALIGILDDCAAGIMINDAIARHVGSLERLETQCKEYIKASADQFGAAVDWSPMSELPKMNADESLAYAKSHPNHYDLVISVARRQIADGDFASVRPLLENMQRLGALTGKSDGPLDLLAQVYRGLNEKELEEAVLRQRVELASNPLDALLRLIEIDREKQRWDQMITDAKEILAIHPMRPDGHQFLAEAAERSDKHAIAAAALKSLGEFEQVDPAGWHFRLASAYHATNAHDEAMHHVLRALDEAPRYRDAHSLLLQIHKSSTASRQGSEP
ncbi:Tetratricopeptide repeat protein [Rubripirellula amarantea]|uniref:Tetratricopeptide repeat protein n=1 Tax=Rubripirellula amarantea TaxID=2527999 RepID=A0A5C5WKZ0_9BACT|nr:peptidase MA family metallohydrolase [Rubripirellula amarantea]TWT51340.1 Tetratricopeptide repeat protein [Rubripirellula amarantea]